MGLCPICFERLKSPVCCVPCGHVFCNVCIHRWRTSSDRPPRGVFFNYRSQETQSCPQCRTEIHNLQRVRFDDHEIQDNEEADIDPWEETDDYSTILKSVYNIWSRSDVRKACLSAQNKIFSVPFVQKCWDAGKLCVGKVGTFVSDFRNVEGGHEVQMEWLKNQAKEVFVRVNNKIISHPKVETLKTQWSNYSEDTKRAIMFLMVVTCVLTLADAQNSQGCLQSVVLPVFQATFSIMLEIIAMVGYCLTRPIACSLHCLMAVILMVLDILGAILRTPIVILEILLCLPYTMIMGLTLFLSNAVGTILRTFLPIGLVLYAFFPGIQQRIREIFAGLQQN